MFWKVLQELWPQNHGEAGPEWNKLPVRNKKFWAVQWVGCHRHHGAHTLDPFIRPAPLEQSHSLLPGLLRTHNHFLLGELPTAKWPPNKSPIPAGATHKPSKPKGSPHLLHRDNSVWFMIQNLVLDLQSLCITSDLILSWFLPLSYPTLLPLSWFLIEEFFLHESSLPHTRLLRNPA